LHWEQLMTHAHGERLDGFHPCVFGLDVWRSGRLDINSTKLASRVGLKLDIGRGSRLQLMSFFPNEPW
jgi:hypothetical protein